MKTFNKKTIGTSAVAFALLIGATQASAFSLGGVTFLENKASVNSDSKANTSYDIKNTMDSSTNNNNENSNNDSKANVDARVYLKSESTTKANSDTDGEVVNKTDSDTSMENHSNGSFWAMLGLNSKDKISDDNNSVESNNNMESEAAVTADTDSNVDEDYNGNSFFTRIGLWFKSMFDFSSNDDSSIRSNSYTDVSVKMNSQ